MNKKKKIAIIGGGAAGFFAALRSAELAKENGQEVETTIFESSGQLLRKVKISGGGRCNVTHHIFDPKVFSTFYPRGQKELISPFNQFQAQDLVQWFEERGVKLKVESDGRMFPQTNKSQTIIDCFLDQCKKYQIKILTQSKIDKIQKNSGGDFTLHFNKEEKALADTVLLATGSVPTSYQLAKNLGHQITDLAPSLFTFKIKHSLIEGLPGISFPFTRLALALEGKKIFLEEGPLLITHWGLSGPAILKLSAWSAREMKRANYKAVLKVNWTGLKRQREVDELLANFQKKEAKGILAKTCPKILPKRFWGKVLEHSAFNQQKRWEELSKKEMRKLSEDLFSTTLEIQGINRFKDEFVECGGVGLKQINFKTMESKICPGLYFAGEVVDVDGLTGGFNFQNAWTGGWIAGSNMGKINN